MATPEQNAMLLMQLFNPVAQNFAANNDARVAQANRMYQLQHEEQLKRDLATQGYDKAIEIENLRGDRAETLQKGMDARQKLLLEAKLTHDDKLLKEAGRKQAASDKAKEKTQISAELNRLYPQYTKAANRAGIKPKARTDFPETSEGLGLIAADLEEANVGYENRRFEQAADLAIVERDDAERALKDEQGRMIQLSQPAPKDQKLARERAVKALQTSIANGDLVETAKLSPKAINSGLAALARGEDAVAGRLLGDEAIRAFASSVDQVLMGLESTKSQLQEKAQSQQRILQLQSNLSRIDSDHRKSAATNPILGGKLKTLRDSMPQPSAMAAPAAAAAARSPQDIFSSFTPPVNQPGLAPAAATAIQGALPNATNEPLISAANQRMAGEEQTRRSTLYNNALDQLQMMETDAQKIRVGNPDTPMLAPATSPIEAFFPSLPLDPNLQAKALADKLKKIAEQKRAVEEARRQMLWLPSPFQTGTP